MQMNHVKILCEKAKKKEKEERKVPKMLNLMLKVSFWKTNKKGYKLQSRNRFPGYQMESCTAVGLNPRSQPWQKDLCQKSLPAQVPEWRSPKQQKMNLQWQVVVPRSSVEGSVGGEGGSGTGAGGRAERQSQLHGDILRGDRTTYSWHYKPCYDGENPPFCLNSREILLALCWSCRFRIFLWSSSITSILISCHSQRSTFQLGVTYSSCNLIHTIWAWPPRIETLVAACLLSADEASGLHMPMSRT